MQLPVGDPVHLQDLFHDSVACLRRLHDIYGNCIAFPNNEWYTVFAFGPEYNYPLFSDSDLFYLAGYPGPKGSSQRLFRDGLFGLNGETQLAHRRLLMEPFRKEAVEGSFGVLAKSINEALASWRVGQVIDLAATIKGYALQLTGRLLFGLESFETAHEVAATFQEWLDHYHTVLFAANLPLETPAGSYEHMLEAADQLVRHFRELVQQRRRTLRPGQNDVLALLLHAFDAGQIADREVMGEMHTFFNAAYQTTAIALTWTLFLLAQHPGAARALREEERAVLAGRPPTPELLPRLTWLNCVIKEALRILPPVVYTQRFATRTTRFGNYDLPRFSFMVPSYYISHHMPEFFPGPEQFRPERWLDANVSPYAYLPFSTGPRMCMGTAFATLLFKIAVTAICQRFRLEVMPGTHIDRHANLTLGIHQPIPVRLHPNDGMFTCTPISGNVLEMVDLPLPAAERRAA